MERNAVQLWVHGDGKSAQFDEDPLLEEEDDNLIPKPQDKIDKSLRMETIAAVILAIILVLLGATSIFLGYWIPKQYLLLNLHQTRTNQDYEDIPEVPGDWQNIPSYNYLNRTTALGTDFEYFKWNSGVFLEKLKKKIHPGEQFFSVCIVEGDVLAFIKEGDFPTDRDTRVNPCDGNDTDIAIMNLCFAHEWVYIGVKNRGTSEDAEPYSLLLVQGIQDKSEVEGVCPPGPTWGAHAYLVLALGLIVGVGSCVGAGGVLFYVTREKRRWAQIL